MDIERIKKVIVWRACSVSATLLITWLFTGDVKEATGFTVILHSALMSLHWSFEKWWENRP